MQPIDIAQPDVDTEATPANLARWDALGDQMAQAIIHIARRDGEFIGGVCWYLYERLLAQLPPRDADELVRRSELWLP